MDASCDAAPHHQGSNGEHGNGSGRSNRSTAILGGGAVDVLPPQLIEDLARLLGEALVGAVRRERMGDSPGGTDHGVLAS
jgi:hypothetical protein